MQQVWILYVFVLILNFFVLIVEKQTVAAKRQRIVNWTAKLNQPKYLGAVLTLKKKFKKCFFKWKSKILWSFVPTGDERLWIPSGLRLIRLILAGDIYKERLQLVFLGLGHYLKFSLRDPKDTLSIDSKQQFGENNVHIPKMQGLWMVFGYLVGYGCQLSFRGI